jgi:hypothetical protein
VPCFLVCNQQGSPYLVPLETGFDVGVVFLDPADAEEMMQSMVQVSHSCTIGGLGVAWDVSARG